MDFTLEQNSGFKLEINWRFDIYRDDYRLKWKKLSWFFFFGAISPNPNWNAIKDISYFY